MPELDPFEDLAEDVRASAPRPRPAFVAQLDRRVEAGFPKPRRERVTLWRPALALAASVLLALVVVSGVLRSPGGDDAEESGSSGGSSGAVAEQAAPAPQAASPGSVPATPSRARVVERRTALDLEAAADEFAGVSDGVLRIADEAGAIVQRSRVFEDGGRGRATFDLRVPASRLDDVLADLGGLAHATSRRASSEDITGSYAAARDRLADARQERRALLRALGRTASAREAEALRLRLADARRRIARASRDVARLRMRADRARLDVTVTSTGQRGDGGAWSPGDALADAGRVLEVAASVAVVAVAVLLPFALLAALAAGSARLARRRRRDAALG